MEIIGHYDHNYTIRESRNFFFLFHEIQMSEIVLTIQTALHIHGMLYDVLYNVNSKLKLHYNAQVPE